MTWSELGVVILPLVRTSVWRRAPPEQQRVAATYCRRVDWRYEILKAFLQAYCKQTSTFPKQFYVQPYWPGPYPPKPGTEWIISKPLTLSKQVQDCRLCHEKLVTHQLKGRERLRINGKLTLAGWDPDIKRMYNSRGTVEFWYMWV